MSNVYDVNDLDPDDLVNRELRRTRASAVLDLEADPEQAARSLQIAKTTGIPAPVVDGDYEHYDGQLRATLTGQLVQQSPELQEYLRRNQMASRVSNDDYQNLDNTSQAVKAIPKKGYLENMGEMYQALWKTVVDGPQEAGRLAESAKDFMLKQGVPPDKAAANAQMFESRAKRNEAIMNALFFIPTALAMPVFAGFRTYAAQPIEEKTGFPAEATEGLAIGALGLIGLPFMRAGKAVPKGVSEATDKVHIEQAKADKDVLGEALKQATSTATRERAPELFENFIKQHTDESIGVNADAVRALYGDKVPAPDDGLLGWVPRLQEQLQAAEATGGDVQIPLASYLTKVDPEVHKALADWVRMRPEGLSVEEAKVGIEPGRPPINEGDAQAQIIDGLRAANRLDPIVPLEEPTMAARPQQLELPAAGTTRMEDRAPFDRGAAIGMTQDQYKRYQGLIAKRLAEDTKAAENRITAQERKKQTAEWKENRAEMRTQVLADLKSQPEYEMLQMLDDGNLKFAADSLTETQRAILPKSWVTKEGIHPDDLAMLFGEGNASALVDRVTGLFSSRAAANMKPMEFTRRMVDVVTDQRMEEKFGKLDENVINEARDQILSETQESMLHEETLAVATQAGQQYPIAKDALISQLRKNFREMTMREVDADRFLSDAGRAGRVAEIALLKGDPLEAFRQKQRQFNAMVFAKEAARVEKLNDQFDRMAKRASARELTGVDQEYLNWVHDVLMRTGNPVKRSVQDLGESLARGAQGDTLAKFVDSVNSFYLREMPVADFIQDPSFNKPVKDLTVTEFQQLHDAVKSMLKNGRDESKINKAGEEADLNTVKKEMIEQVQQLPQLEYDAKGERIHPGYIPVKGAKEIRKFGVSHIQTESMLNRIDKGNAWGVFNQYVMRPLVESSHRESQLERAYAKEVRALESTKFDHKRALPNDILMDPYSVRRGDPQPLRLTEENLMAVIMNMGNESNFDKFARGYLAATDTMPAGDNYLAVFKDQLRQWVYANSTKEHWDWAQKFGDVYEKFKREEVDPMYRRVAGIEPASLEIEGVSTPRGDYKGWYYPVIYHPLYEGTSRVLMGGDALEGPHYTRATTPHGYIEKRTGYAGPIDLSLDRGITRLKEMIHDVAFREAVINASKVFYDKDIRASIAHHMNKEYRDMLVPYLRDVANASAIRNELRVLDGSLGETIRQNLISTLVGMNPGTVAKHGFTALMQSIHEVGGKEFLNAVSSMTVKDLDVAESNWKFAMKHGGELQRRVRNYQEVLRGGSENLFRDATWRDVMIKAGSYPVATSDLLSAVPTWIAQYKKTFEQTGEHGDAVFMADRAVRRAHGSTAITNRPAIMREGNLWFTSLYGFFNHIMNRQYEIAWKAADAINKPGVDEAGRRLVKTSEGTYIPEEAKTGAAIIPTLAGATLAYVLYPALVEELVTPLPEGKDEGWGKWAGKALVKDLSSSWIFARDIANGILTGRDPSAGLVSTAMTTLTRFARDAAKDRPLDRRNRGKTLQDSITLFGAASGLTNQQMGRDARFMHDYLTGEVKPKGFGEWYRGLRYGTTKEFH